MNPQKSPRDFRCPRPNLATRLAAVVLPATAVFLLSIAAITNPAIIRGTSMATTFVGPAIGFHRPAQFQVLQRGDIISFRTRTSDQLKRVVGLPGETVLLANGHVYVWPSGALTPLLLRESYVPATVRTYHFGLRIDGQAAVYDVPKDSVFVLADNRATGSDSRTFADDRLLPSPFVPSYSFESRVIAVLSRNGLQLTTSPPVIEYQPVPRGLIPLCPQAQPCRPVDQLELAPPQAKAKAARNWRNLAFYPPFRGSWLALWTLFGGQSTE